MNYDTLFATLNSIRIEAEQARAKIAIPQKLMRGKSSAGLTAWLNADTKARLKALEDAVR